VLRSRVDPDHATSFVTDNLARVLSPAAGLRAMPAASDHLMPGGRAAQRGRRAERSAYTTMPCRMVFSVTTCGSTKCRR
jgi:hypothetical protein